MTHTTTEEDRFHIHCRSAVLTTAAETARSRLRAVAEKSGYSYMVEGTWLMTVKLAGNGDYFAEVQATFAKIVLADQPTEPGEDLEEGNAADENTEPAPSAPVLAWPAPEPF